MESSNGLPTPEEAAVALTQAEASRTMLARGVVLPPSFDAAIGAWCLTIATNAIVTWISEYYGRAIAEMRAGGHLIQDEVLAHLWPTHHDNVNFHHDGPSTEHHRPATRDRSRARRVGWLVV